MPALALDQGILTLLSLSYLGVDLLAFALVVLALPALSNLVIALLAFALLALALDEGIMGRLALALEEGIMGMLALALDQGILTQLALALDQSILALLALTGISRIHLALAKVAFNEGGARVGNVREGQSADHPRNRRSEKGQLLPLGSRQVGREKRV